MSVGAIPEANGVRSAETMSQIGLQWTKWISAAGFSQSANCIPDLPLFPAQRWTLVSLDPRNRDYRLESS